MLEQANSRTHADDHFDYFSAGRILPFLSRIGDFKSDLNLTILFPTPGMLPLPSHPPISPTGSSSAYP